MRVMWTTVACLLLSIGFLSAQSNCIKGDCINGYGEAVFPSGARYVGNFRAGKIEGKGILYFSDGNKYIGHWINQRREGTGRMVFKNGDDYRGNFSDNKMQGQGIMVYISGNRYEGDWLNNHPHGFGVFTYANGDMYEGNFQEGQCWGEGTMSYADGSRYQGNWERNRRHGYGTLSLVGQNPLSGQWTDDQFQEDVGRQGGMVNLRDTSSMRNCNNIFCASGSGRYAYRDGSRYYGQFLNGVPEGQGLIYYVSGDYYEGGWKGHAPHGQGVMTYTSGKVVGAVWDAGRPVQMLYEQYRPVSQVNVSVDQDDEIKIWAVIVGVARYSHMPVLRYTDDDAYQVYAFLKSPEGGAVPDDQLKLLIDEEASHDKIVNAIRMTFLRADANDVVIFYFSGHGVQGAFLPSDYDGYNNRLPHQEIQDLLKASQARHKLVLADACHSGSLLAARTPVHVAIKKYYAAFEEAHAGTALLMSSKGEEFSLEDGGLRSGIFSHFLIRGLKGEADADRDRIISVEELFNFVYRNVRIYTGNVQTPTLTGTYDARMPVGVVRR